jgi:PAS domain S-box-containing protein
MTQTIRQKAEAILKEQYPLKELTADADLPRILHELQVHQIELELQNDELRHTQAELKDTQKKYFDLFNFAPIGYFTLNGNGVIAEVNLAGAELLGKERSRLIGKPLQVYLNPKSRPQFFQLFDTVFKYRGSQTGELTMRPKNGPEIFVQVKAQAAQESDGTGYCRLVMTDITERKQMEEALIHSEALGRAIINALSAHIAVLDEQGNIIATNNNWLRFGIENGVVARSAITEGANYLEV